MVRDANQAKFELEVATIDVPLKVYAFNGVEGISQPFAFSVTFVCDEPNLVLEDWLQLPVRLTMHHDNELMPRFICGMVFGMEKLTHTDRHCQYQLTVTPRVQLLAHRTTFRIFQNLSVPDIITAIFTDAGILSHEYEVRLSGSFTAREYSVQYGESDMAFISRLMSEAGLHYHFEHSDTGHVIVIADGQDGFLELPPLAYSPHSGMAKIQDVISEFTVRDQTRRGKASLRDFTFERPDFKPQASVATNIANEQALEGYCYPGQFSTQAEGTGIATRTLEQGRIDKRQVSGVSDYCQLTSGYYQPLQAHPNDAWNEPWLLTEVKHRGIQPQVLEEHADGIASYHAEFIATPWEAAYRMQPIAKPLIHNIDTAIVTGPDGEEIYCDEYGRVKVQFHWDRQGQANETTSCWLRVAQGWAGNGYGQFVLPRIGHEVIVSFIHGDPDKPIITGALYNTKNQVPYALTEHKTRSTFKTSSSVGGQNFNEWRFDDKINNEQIYLHAAKDLDTTIQNIRTQEILNADHLTVHDCRYQEIKVDDHSTVNGNQFEKVGGDNHHETAGTLHTKIGSKHLTEAGSEIHIKVGNKAVIEAGSEITLKGGGSFVKIDPSGIKLVGPGIKLNSGGSAGRGSGYGGQPPQLPRVIGQAAALAASTAMQAQTATTSMSLAAFGNMAKRAVFIQEECDCSGEDTCPIHKKKT
ncbi:type VI secretion system tip protein TssI/VgrG [Photobacterium lipolyticum]|uniref:Type VI secretion system tip protein VgrG n=1 Tax=Photobacterium lipolyticum TaxID=266810 RepID=A0A2T3MYN7_9GAMM|nr:type VI secretion system tip protein TssI/VgrG [Photobacterium lipolyticum]PSW05085.1 type VI secretion system tip protein VgrG [Photobacterium lipolyticum]